MPFLCFQIMSPKRPIDASVRPPKKFLVYFIMTPVKGLYILDFFELPKFQTHNTKWISKDKKSLCRSYLEKAFNTLKYSPSKCLFYTFELCPPKGLLTLQCDPKKVFSLLDYNPCKGTLHLGFF